MLVSSWLPQRKPANSTVGGWKWLNMLQRKLRKTEGTNIHKWSEEIIGMEELSPAWRKPPFCDILVAAGETKIKPLDHVKMSSDRTIQCIELCEKHGYNFGRSRGQTQNNASGRKKDHRVACILKHCAAIESMTIATWAADQNWLKPLNLHTYRKQD